MTRRGGVPPKEYRFRKSETGNPKGRPRSSTQTRKSAFDVITDPELTIRKGETTTTLSAEETLHLKTYQQAIGGDKKAWAELLDMIIAREKALDALAPPTPGPELLIEKGDPDNAHEAMVLLGIASYDTERMIRSAAASALIRNGVCATFYWNPGPSSWRCSTDLRPYFPPVMGRVLGLI